MQTEDYECKWPETVEEMAYRREHEKTIMFHVPFIKKVVESPEEEWVEMEHLETGGMIPCPFRLVFAGERKDGSVHFNEGMLKKRTDGQMGLIPMYSVDLPEPICQEILQAIKDEDWSMIRPEEIWEAMKNETQTGEDV
jgi:hypothetical protein